MRLAKPILISRWRAAVPLFLLILNSAVATAANINRDICERTGSGWFWKAGGNCNLQGDIAPIRNWVAGDVITGTNQVNRKAYIAYRDKNDALLNAPPPAINAGAAFTSTIPNGTAKICLDLEVVELQQLESGACYEIDLPGFTPVHAVATMFGLLILAFVFLLPKQRGAAADGQSGPKPKG